MRGLSFVTVIMDGSDKGIVKCIMEVIDMVTQEYYGKSTCRDFDADHPTMKVIETITDKATYEEVSSAIEGLYPGLCVFNPAM